MKRTMVFYCGRAPNGKKTDWKMNEYKAIQLDHEAFSSNKLEPKVRAICIRKISLYSIN
jgi:hypothetical protein